jgi:MFS family permease
MADDLKIRPDAAAMQPQSVTAGHGRWALLILLTIGVMIAFVDRTSISAAIADKGFVRQFAMTSVDRGFVNSAYFWTYGLFQLFMGWLVDRYGVKWPYAVFFAVWCAATAATGLVSSFAALIAARLVIGAAESAAIPASYRWIRNNFDDRKTGTAVGIFTSGNKLGSAIGAPVAAWLIVEYNWRAMFLLTGAVGAAWLIPWLLMTPNDLPTRTEAAAAKREANSVSWASIMASPVVWGGLVVNFCYGYFTFFCATWMPAYLVEQRGLSLEQSGLYTFLSFAGVAVVAVAGGWAADKLIARGGDRLGVRKAFVVAGFIGGCTVLLGARAQSVPTALFWNVASLSLLGLATANLQALCRLALIPRQAVGRVTGVQQVATSLSGGVTASLSGWLLHVSGSYELPMFIIFVFLIVGAAATWILMQPKWSPKVVEITPAPEGA